jgi:hypothetical protein
MVETSGASPQDVFPDGGNVGCVAAGRVSRWWKRRVRRRRTCFPMVETSGTSPQDVFPDGGNVGCVAAPGVPTIRGPRCGWMPGGRLAAAEAQRARRGGRERHVIRALIEQPAEPPRWRLDRDFTR